MNQPQTSAERVLWSASPPPTTPGWEGLHDQVMGGRSQGNALFQMGDSAQPDHVLFAGQISTANGGGFASYRLRLLAPVVIDAAHAVVITWRGDGGPFKLCLHRQNDWDGVQWQADLPTTSHWLTQVLPLSVFVARRRGRMVEQPLLSPTDALFQIGLLTARPVSGPFALALAHVVLR